MSRRGPSPRAGAGSGARGRARAPRLVPLLLMLGCGASETPSRSTGGVPHRVDGPTPATVPAADGASDLEGPVWVPTGTRLHVEPSASSWGFELQLEPSDATPPRALFSIRSVRSGWVEIETLSASDASCPPQVEGLDAFSLALFVPRRALDLSDLERRPLAEAFPCPSEPAPDAAAAPALPPLQHGDRAGHPHDQEWALAAGTRVYWPDGTLAGRVTRAHRYMKAPTPRGELSCVEVRFGSATESQASLCAAPDAFTEHEYEDPEAQALRLAREAGVLGLLAAEGSFDQNLFGIADLDARDPWGDAEAGLGLRGDAEAGLGLRGDAEAGLGSRGDAEAGLGGELEALKELEGVGLGGGPGAGVGAGGVIGIAPQGSLAPASPELVSLQLFGGPEGDGPLPEAEFERILLDALQACRGDSASVRASLTLSVEFDDSGRPKRVEVEGGEEPGRRACVEVAAGRLQARGAGVARARLRWTSR